MYLQLYRSKVQFYRKFGGERRAATFKRGLRLAYWLRGGDGARGHRAAVARPAAGYTAACWPRWAGGDGDDAGVLRLRSGDAAVPLSSLSVWILSC